MLGGAVATLGPDCAEVSVRGSGGGHPAPTAACPQRQLPHPPLQLWRGQKWTDLVRLLVSPQHTHTHTHARTHARTRTHTHTHENKRRKKKERKNTKQTNKTKTNNNNMVVTASASL